MFESPPKITGKPQTSTMSNNSVNPKNPLLVPDLFHCVLECLITSLPQRPSKEERRTLAVLARTCRAFSEPSLNCLWRRLNSLLPLVRCFADVADEASVKVVTDQFDHVDNIHDVNRPLHPLSNGSSLIDTPLASKNLPWGMNIYPYTSWNVRASSYRI